MPRQSRDFKASIKSVQVKGETKVDADGAVLAEPEMVITLTMPMTNANIRAMTFLAAAKVSGLVDVTIASAQLMFDLAEEVAARS